MELIAINFIVNYVVPGKIVIQADSEEQAKEKFYQLSETEIADNCGFDAVCIENME